MLFFKMKAFKWPDDDALLLQDCTLVYKTEQNNNGLDGGTIHSKRTD